MEVKIISPAGGGGGGSDVSDTMSLIPPLETNNSRAHKNMI